MDPPPDYDSILRVLAMLPAWGLVSRRGRLIAGVNATDRNTAIVTLRIYGGVDSRGRFVRLK